MFLLKRVILLLCFPIVLEQTIIPFFVNIINIYLGIHNSQVLLFKTNTTFLHTKEC